MTNSFAQLGLPEPLVRALTNGDNVEPFSVQAVTIPDVLAGKDVSGKAPTGSGKTLAFGLLLSPWSAGQIGIGPGADSGSHEVGNLHL